MAGIDDPFTPGETQDPTAGLPDASTFSNLVGQWNQFLSDPRGRGALLSAGLAMMQPRSFGDTPASQVGRAVGDAGASVRTADEQDRKDQELASKQELRGAQSNLAGARSEAAAANSNTAATRAAAATDRLGLQGEIERGRNERHTLGQQVRLSQLYQQAINQIRTLNARNQRQNADPFNRGQAPLPIVPVPTMQEWLQTNPAEVQGLFTQPAGGTPAQGAPVSPPAGQAELQNGQQVPAASRVRGQTYQTPRGPMEWTGTGWKVPGGSNTLE